MRSRLRERLDDLLAQTPLPVRQERLAAPQVRLLESRFVLDASAAVADDDRPAGAAAGAADGPPQAPKNALMPPGSEQRLRWSGVVAVLPVEAGGPGM